MGVSSQIGGASCQANVFCRHQKLNLSRVQQLKRSVPCITMFSGKRSVPCNAMFSWVLEIAEFNVFRGQRKRLVPRNK